MDIAVLCCGIRNKLTKIIILPSALKDIDIQSRAIMTIKGNKMELFQSQAPVKRELLGSSVVRIMEF